MVCETFLIQFMKGEKIYLNCSSHGDADEEKTSKIYD